ncbi:MAG TPA: hypothetical protein VG271_15420 [Beijerinckiaceae bacterium]|nr:hypothetical protein [Beijerinckiaceae bacterium]
MRAFLFFLLIASLPAALFAQQARDPDIPLDEMAVSVANKSGPVLCAENDNVDLEFSSPDVRRFTIQAVHPSYIGTIGSDRYAPDGTSCDYSHDSSFPADTKRVTFWETPQFWLTGYTLPSFWKPANVPVRVGDKVIEGLDLVQLWMLYRERAEEVLVIYPPDGYWRARPLPFADMRWTAYGSSFLLGPVEYDQRPMVAMKELAFDPATKTFTLSFVRGGSATLRLDTIDQNHIALDAALAGPMPDGRPFAALRSMYVTDFDADVTKVAWRTKGGLSWGESPVMTFPGTTAVELWAGRTAISRHNTSAPDMVFNNFSPRPVP